MSVFDRLSPDIYEDVGSGNMTKKQLSDKIDSMCLADQDFEDAFLDFSHKNAISIIYNVLVGIYERNE